MKSVDMLLIEAAEREDPAPVPILIDWADWKALVEERDAAVYRLREIKASIDGYEGGYE